MQIFNVLLVSTTMGLSWAISVASAEGPQKGKEVPEFAWGKPVEGWRMSLRLAKSEYCPGEKLEVQIVLQNADSKNRYVTVSNILRTHKFTVTGANGIVVPMSDRGKKRLETALIRGSYREEILKPVQEETAMLEFSEMFDLQKPGEYQIFVTREVCNRDNDKKFSTVTSNTLAFKVTEKPAKKDKEK